MNHLMCTAVAWWLVRLTVYTLPALAPCRCQTAFRHDFVCNDVLAARCGGAPVCPAAPCQPGEVHTQAITGWADGPRRHILQGGYSSHVVVQEDFVCRVPDNLNLAGEQQTCCIPTPQRLPEHRPVRCCMRCVLPPGTRVLTVAPQPDATCHSGPPCVGAAASTGAAPLLCAGITVYSPLRHYQLDQPGMKLGIIGLGGLGHMVRIPGLGGPPAELSPVSSRLSFAARAAGQLFLLRFSCCGNVGNFCRTGSPLSWSCSRAHINGLASAAVTVSTSMQRLPEAHLRGCCASTTRRPPLAFRR